MMQGIGPEVNTLDEPVWDTLKRDLVAIAVKTRHVMLPNGQVRVGQATKQQTTTTNANLCLFQGTKGAFHCSCP
jgi:hypothetical protein